MILTIQKKIVIAVFTIVVFICLLFAYFVKQRTSKLFINYLEEESLNLARHYASMSEKDLITGQYLQLDLLLNDLKERRDDILYIFIQDRKGQVVAHSYQTYFPVQLKSLPSPDKESKYRKTFLYNGNEKIMDISLPIIEGNLGILHLGMSTGFIKKVQLEVLIIVGEVLVFTVVPSLVLAYILSRKLTGPLAEFVRATEEFVSGNRDLRLKELRKDEIGQLSKVFNKMADSLDKTTVSRSEFKKQAEKLEIQNNELSILYKLSSEISRCKNFLSLGSVVVEVITHSLAFPVKDKQGGLLLVENDRLHLIAHSGHSREFLELHENMKIGDCLCGKAAETGKIILSDNCFQDPDHTFRPKGMVDHGHIILPIRFQENIIAVLYLYTMEGKVELSRNQYRLLESISSQVGIAIENVKLLEDTKFLSYHDPLTKLPNRRYMEQFLGKSFFQATRYDQDLSLIMMDIDFFKIYNDTHGHRAGDILLASLAQLLLNNVRQPDFAARYGGEEFLVVLPNTSLDNACVLAERLRTKIAVEIDCTVSMGVTELDKMKMKRIEDFINSADKALYLAKENGRNRVEVV